jgi:DNA-binding FadR family transcriptional regulator
VKRLCHSARVSRPVLRQALARLRDEGRIYARKGSGTFVTDALPQTKPISLSTLENIADIRAFLEFDASWKANPPARWRAPPIRMHQIRLCRERFEQAPLQTEAMPWRKTSPSTTRWPKPAATASSA